MRKKLLALGAGVCAVYAAATVWLGGRSQQAFHAWVGLAATTLPRPVAIKLATQTVLGTAKMIAETGRHPGELKDAVTSPAGTTIAAIKVLEQNGLRGALVEAVATSASRSKELGS